MKEVSNTVVPLVYKSMHTLWRNSNNISAFWNNSVRKVRLSLISFSTGKYFKPDGLITMQLIKSLLWFGQGSFGHLPFSRNVRANVNLEWPTLSSSKHRKSMGQSVSIIYTAFQQKLELLSKIVGVVCDYNKSSNAGFMSLGVGENSHFAEKSL